MQGLGCQDLPAARADIAWDTLFDVLNLDQPCNGKGGGSTASKSYAM